MADAPPPSEIAPAEAQRPLARGVSQWQMIWQQFRQRRTAMACGVFLLFLATVSIFAPFLAYDRPIWYRGVNRFEYQQAARNLRAMIGQIIQAQNAATTPAPDRIAEQLEIVALQVRLMRAELPEETSEALRDFHERLIAAAEGGDTAALAELRTESRQEFDERRVELVTSSHWPVVAALVWSDLLFMLLTVMLATYPVWRAVVHRLVPSEHPAARAWLRSGILFGLPVLAALAWWLTVPERVDRTNYKNAVFVGAETEDDGRAHVFYESAIWPPIPYGLDEDNLDIKFAPPQMTTAAGTRNADAAGADTGSAEGEDAEAEDTEATAAVPARPWEAPHLLGTDEVGRDVLSRMLWGGRISLAVGIVAVAIYVALGVIIGALAGYFRGTTDMLISRLIEIVICFPSFFLILTIVAFVGPSLLNIMVVIGLTGWTGVARLVRGEFLRLNEQEFVLAGRALGYTPLRIIARHVLPNAMAPVLVAASFGIAGAILTESALSFLGFGITVPKPSWGGILSSGRAAIFRAPWLIWIPGLAIFLTITAYNLVGEAFRDAADPRLRGERT